MSSGLPSTEGQFESEMLKGYLKGHLFPVTGADKSQKSAGETVPRSAGLN